MTRDQAQLDFVFDRSFDGAASDQLVEVHLGPNRRRRSATLRRRPARTLSSALPSDSGGTPAPVGATLYVLGPHRRAVRR